MYRLAIDPGWRVRPGAAGGEEPSTGDLRLWSHCRNILGIARLLVTERRSAPLVSTACYMAVDTACRVALARAGLPPEGDVESALARLEAPAELRESTPRGGGVEQLACAERQVSWVADDLRAGAPGRFRSV